MTAAPFPLRADELSPAWLASVLGAPVQDLRVRRIGEDEGFTGGTLWRLELDTATPGLPGSLVAKLAPEPAGLRAAMAPATRREVAFYTRFAGDRPLPVPRCAFAAIAEETGAGLLLLEDLGPLRASRFEAGCAPEDARRAVEALAQVHARFWDDPRLKALGGASLLRDFRFAEAWARYPEAVRALLPEVALPAWFHAFGDALAARAEAVFADLFESGPMTLLHRDPQLDNILFDDRPGGRGAVLIDWQMAGHGRAGYDLGYFLVSSLAPAVRRQHGAALIRAYHAALQAGGVRGYSLAECEADCRLALAGKLVTTVMATTLLDNSTPHKRAWRRADLDRILAFAGELDGAGRLMALAGAGRDRPPHCRA